MVWTPIATPAQAPTATRESDADKKDARVHQLAEEFSSLVAERRQLQVRTVAAHSAREETQKAFGQQVTALRAELRDGAPDRPQGSHPASVRSSTQPGTGVPDTAKMPTRAPSESAQASLPSITTALPDAPAEAESAAREREHLEARNTSDPAAASADSPHDSQAGLQAGPQASANTGSPAGSQTNPQGDTATTACSQADSHDADQPARDVEHRDDATAHDQDADPAVDTGTALAASDGELVFEFLGGGEQHTGHAQNSLGDETGETTQSTSGDGIASAATSVSARELTEAATEALADRIDDDERFGAARKPGAWRFCLLRQGREELPFTVTRDADDAVSITLDPVAQARGATLADLAWHLDIGDADVVLDVPAARGSTTQGSTIQGLTADGSTT